MRNEVDLEVAFVFSLCVVSWNVSSSSPGRPDDLGEKVLQAELIE